MIGPHPNPDGHLVVVGAGIGGVRTAEAARSSGWRGRITLIGAHRGLPYDLPPLSKQVLSGEWPPEQARLLTPMRLSELAVNYLEDDAAVGLDRRWRSVRLRSGRNVGYDALVIASGASARQWSTDLGNHLHTIRTLEDSERLRSELAAARGPVAVIGSGFVAAEAAATIAAASQKPVHLVCREAGPCQHTIGTPLSRWLRSVHERNGVIVHAGRTAERIHFQAPTSYRIELDDNSAIEAQTVVLGIGAVPNVGWLAGAGLPTSDGIITNTNGRVSPTEPDEFIYAIGDCARWTASEGIGARGQHWTSAVEQARLVGAALCTSNDRNTTVGTQALPYVWSDQFDAKVQVLGRIGPHDEVHHLDLQTRTAVAVYGRNRTVTAVVLIGLPRQAIRIRRLLQSVRDVETIVSTVSGSVPV